MDRLQWRVLYRQFLFRVFDPEVLSAQAQGDATKMLGQFASLLIFFSMAGSLAALLASGSKYTKWREIRRRQAGVFIRSSWTPRARFCRGITAKQDGIEKHDENFIVDWIGDKRADRW